MTETLAAHDSSAGEPADELALGTRERILRAAASQFRQRGFHGTSMQDLAEEVGVTKSSLYHHFPSKQALLSEILEFTVERVTPHLEEVLESDRPSTEKLRSAVRLHVQAAIEDRDNVACFVEEGRALAPAFLDAQIPKRDYYEGCFRRILEEGVERGEMEVDDVALVGLAILGMCNGVVRWYRADGPRDPHDIGDEFAELAVRMTIATTGHSHEADA